jgi:hypothetical protein
MSFEAAEKYGKRHGIKNYDELISKKEKSDKK